MCNDDNMGYIMRKSATLIGLGFFNELIGSFGSSDIKKEK
jgi:hypothetical protein